MRSCVALLLGLLAQCAAQDDFGNCGQNLDIGETRIAGVIETASDPLGTWPWMASVGLLKEQEWNHLCGAVIISEKFVLTAAHCMVDESLLLRLGDKNLKSIADDFGANIRQIADRIIHPKYDPTARNAYYDIAILKTRPSLIYTSYIRPICMPPVTQNLDQYAGHQVTVTGWGFSTRNLPDGGEDLRSVPIKIFPQRACNETHSAGIRGAQEFEISKHLPRLFTPDILCAGYERPLYGPCKGDSGSPLVKYEFDSHRYVLLGLVQGGIGSCGDKDFPAIFTRVDAEEIHNFIAEETGIVEKKDAAPPQREQIEDRIDGNGNSLLMLSAKRKEYDTVKTLLEQGSNVNHANHDGQNALMLASGVNGTLRMANLLLRNDIDVRQRDSGGRSALHYAAEAGNLPVLQSLLTKGLSVDPGDADNATPLCYAVERGKYGTARHLLQQGADVNATTLARAALPLHFATFRREGSSVIRLLLAFGAGLDSRDAHDATPFYTTFTTFSSYLLATQLLHELGADVHAVNEAGETVLHKAAFRGSGAHVRWLRGLDRGAVLARMIDRQDYIGETALITAAYRGNEDVADLLLAYGADRSIRDGSGRTALDWARLKAFNGIVQLLQGVFK